MENNTNLDEVYLNIDKDAPGYKGGTGGSSMSIGAGGTGSNPNIVMLFAGEDVFAGQVLQVRGTEEATQEQIFLITLDDTTGARGVRIGGVSYPAQPNYITGGTFIRINGRDFTVKYDSNQVDYIDFEGIITMKQVFIQNAQRDDHNATIGIATADAGVNVECPVQIAGVYDYAEVLASKAMPVFDGVQLFCVNNDTNKNVNFATEPLQQKDANNLIVVGELVSPTQVKIAINEYIYG